MKKTSNILAILLCAVLSVGTFTACGTKGDADKSASSIEKETQKNEFARIDDTEEEKQDYKSKVVDEYSKDKIRFPKFDVDTQVAKALNATIKNDLVDLLGDSGVGYMDYKVYQKNGSSIVSAVVEYSYLTDDMSYFVYTYDFENDIILRNEDVLEQCNIPFDQFVERVNVLAKEKFDEQYPDAGQDGITAIGNNMKNINTDLPLYLDDDGNLIVAVPVASLAGAEFYYHLLQY